MRKKAGFTLIEIIIVLILVGLFAATMGANYFISPGLEAETERVRMAARLSHARTQAALEGGGCLVFRKNGVQYQNMTPLFGEPVSVDFSDGVEMSGFPESLCFDENGHSTAVVDNYLYFSDGKSSLPLRIVGYTGYALAEERSL